MVALALYNKPGRWTNRAIRLRTGSVYSHCELVVDGMCFSSSGRDRGVRSKVIDLADGGWDLIEIPWASKEVVLSLFSRTQGCSYDYVGCILGAGLGVHLQDERRWMCSEWCAAGLGLSEPWRFTPADLGAAMSPWALGPQKTLG